MKLIHQDASAEALRFLRKWVFGVWLIIIALDPFPSLAYLPPSLLEPTGFLMTVLPQSILALFFNAAFLAGFKIFLIFVLTCSLFDRFFIPAGFLAGLLLTVHQGYIRSFGDINHSELCLLYAAYLLVLFAMADNFLIKRSEHPLATKINFNSIPLIVILAVICFTYTFIGIHRIVHGGTAVFFSDNLKFWIIENSNVAESSSWHLDTWTLQHPWILTLLKLGFPILTFFEIFAPLCLISSRFRFVFLCVIIPFHILTWVFMNIIFREHLALFILFFDFSSRWKNNATRT